jgi:hypothetical protein
MVTISSDLAWALGMVPDCLVPIDDAPHYRDENGAGWFWYRETREGPQRGVCITIIRLQDDNDDCA